MLLVHCRSGLGSRNLRQSERAPSGPSREIRTPFMPETVVITGASAGVGRATAHAFAALGAQIGLIARGTQALQGAAAEVEQRGGKALALPLDIADPDAVDAAAERVESRFGQIDIWVNCSMATIFAP